MQYDVYGLGNALVDYEYEVTPLWLEQQGIDKGVMTLMDEDQQIDIMGSIDHGAVEKASGGSGANSIIALAQMGGKAFYTCRVADDHDGTFYAQDMLDCGVDSNIVHKKHEDGTTGKCLVMVTPDADRTMNTFLGISAELDESDLDFDALKASNYLYMEGFLVSSDSARAAAIKARDFAHEHGIKTALSLADPNMVKFFKEGLEEMIGDGVDLLFSNEEEAMGMTGTDDAYAAAAALKPYANTFAITRGAEGALVYDGQDLIKIDPVPTKAIDTLGAGDMFAGAFLYGLSQNMGFERAGQLASLASSRMVSRFGPRFNLSETRAILRDFEAA
ncbi:carbohydrate kinase, PfkB family [gamma proteobacterium HTCC5015]|nr:carbohydrate kinase, PfkB family [gamma proteobacterium HTCC5015]